MIFIKKCENCGTKFQTSKKNQKFCNDTCRRYFRKKINIIVVPKRPPKIEVPYFGKRKHRNPPHIINDTKRIIKKLKKKKN